MPLLYPNIVPPNDLRLPDALTIKHGPRELLARFVLEADKAARRLGIRLRLRHDFENFARLNEFEVGRGNWYPLFDIFNHANFGQPGRTAQVGSTAFGVITNTRFPTGDSGSSRQMQFALKYKF